MPPQDPFYHLAPYYNPLMEHVDYERWRNIIGILAAMLPAPCIHVDVACGTGTLIHMLRCDGWHPAGVDLSEAMLQAGQKAHGPLPFAAADMRALPFKGRIHLITCLFDSLNFLLNESEVQKAMSEFYQALQNGGLLYFDVVTERMVTEYFENRTWTEQSSEITSTWSSAYDRHSALANTRIHIHGKESSLLQERIYPILWLINTVRHAGFDVLACYDAHTWKQPNPNTIRVDFIAGKLPSSDAVTCFNTVVAEKIRNFLRK